MQLGIVQGCAFGIGVGVGIESLRTAIRRRFCLFGEGFLDALWLLLRRVGNLLFNLEIAGLDFL